MGREIPLAVVSGKGLLVPLSSNSGCVSTHGASVSALKGIEGVPSIMSFR